MEENVKDYDFMIFILFALNIFTLVFTLVANEGVLDLEDKLNGNCIYVNNEFYCKD